MLNKYIKEDEAPQGREQHVERHGRREMKGSGGICLDRTQMKAHSALR